MKKKIAVYANAWGANNLSSFLKGIDSAFLAAGLDADLFTFLSYGYFSMPKSDELGEISIFELGDPSSFDGAIVFSNGLNNPQCAEKIVKSYVEKGIPVVSLGMKIEGSSFVTTNVAGMYELAEHLINEHNVRDITFFAGNVGNYDSDSRMEAVESALNEVGEKIHNVVYTDWGTDTTITYITDHYKDGKNLPDALVCANDYIALAACYELHKLGIKIPEDVIVTGFDGIRDGKIFCPSLSTVCQDYFKQGIACGDIIVNQLTSGKIEPVEQFIDSYFFPGESCGCLTSRDSRGDRDEACREYYAERTERVFFNDHMSGIEATLYSCDSLADIRKVMSDFFTRNHSIEGPNFWVIGEKSYATSIYNDEVKMRRKTFSDELQVWVAISDGVSQEFDTMKKRDLIPGYTEKTGSHNYFFIPIHVNDILYGYLVMENCYTMIEDFTLEVYRRSIKNALDKHRQSLKLEYLNRKLMELYTRDSLTGLYNRFGYECLAVPMFKKATEKNHSCAVIFLDINRMKYINDNFGHLQGDLAIRTIASAISQIAPEPWIGIRYGGDEYLVIGECNNEDEVKSLVEELEAGIKKQVSKMKLPFHLTVSSGYIMTDPSSSYSLSEYIQKADDSMYENKKIAHETDDNR